MLRRPPHSAAALAAATPLWSHAGSQTPPRPGGNGSHECYSYRGSIIVIIIIPPRCADARARAGSVITVLNKQARCSAERASIGACPPACISRSAVWCIIFYATTSRTVNARDYRNHRWLPRARSSDSSLFSPSRSPRCGYAYRHSPTRYLRRRLLLLPPAHCSCTATAALAGAVEVIHNCSPAIISMGMDIRDIHSPCLLHRCFEVFFILRKFGDVFFKKKGGVNRPWRKAH